MERRADEAERELLQWKKVRFMADKVGDEFEGYITGVAPYGLFVELIEHYVEGLVHVSSMADDYYRFVEQQHVLRGENTKKVYRLGDKVLVQVVRVDMERRQVDLGTGRDSRGRAAGGAAAGPDSEQDETEAGAASRPAAGTSRATGRQEGRQAPLGLLRPVLVGVLEIPDSPADPSPDLGQPVGAENQHQNRKNDE